MDIKINKRKLPLIITAILIIIGLIFHDNIAIMGNLILLGIIIGIIPYALFSYFEYSRIKSIEDQMPVFLLDLAESQKVGLTLNESLKQASKVDYGKLTPEIQKVYYQLSWGIPVKDVFNDFANRMEKSKLIGRVVRIINESYVSGGDIGRTMEATASDITAIKEAEKQRRSVTSQHTFIMYAIYFIFIGIVVGLSQTLIPLLKLNTETAAIGGIMSFRDPCVECVNNPSLYCVSCKLFPVICQMFALQSGASCYYNALFIVMAIVQGIFTGLVAGQMGEGSVSAGVKHSIIMTIAGFGALFALLKLGIMGG